MSEQPTGGHPRPNIVLRGGPFEGRQLYQDDPHQTLAINEGRGPFFLYRPTGETDAEYATLTVFVLDHMEPL